MATAGRRFGPVRLEAGVTIGHALMLCYAAFVTIGIVTVVSVLTPYVLAVNVGVPGSRQGQALSVLNLVSELTLIMVYGIAGALADRIGRRAVFAFGFAAITVAYLLYPQAGSLWELAALRMLCAVGIGCATGMIATVVADYAREIDRGKFVAITSVLNGLGVVVISLLVGRLPEIFAARGMTPRDAGEAAFAVAAGICAVTAVLLWIGLKPGVGPTQYVKLPFATLIRHGVSAARTNRRIALSYAAAFVARGDLVIVGTFAVAWGKLAAVQANMAPGAALAKGSLPFVVSQGASLVWALVAVAFIDRLNRTTALALSMVLAAVGYGALWLVPDPLAAGALPFFVLLGIGQVSAFLGAQSIISKEAPENERGAVIGMFNLSGAIGILILVSIGGWLFDHVSPQATFVMIGALNAVVALLAIGVRLAERGAPARPETRLA